MAVLYCFVSNIIHYNGAFNPNSVTFTLYYCIIYRVFPHRRGVCPPSSNKHIQKDNNDSNNISGKKKMGKTSGGRYDEGK